MKKSIGVFFGSRAPEHDVSIITAQLIMAGLRDLGHDVWPIYISKKGKWYIGKQMDSVVFFQDSDKTSKLDKMKEYSLELDESNGKMVFKSKGMFGKNIEIDLAFPALHGLNGEDGTMQGIYELVGVPYVGCDVASSAIAMDKVLTKLFYKSIDVDTVDFVYVENSTWMERKDSIKDEIERKLDYPVMIKPSRLGSSIGISKAKDRDELDQSIDLALHYDNKVIIENCITDLMDITCAVIGNKIPKPSLLQESSFQSDFFSYDDKYLNDGGAQLGKAESRLKIPASLDDETTKKIQEASVRIFETLGCSGIARFDFLYDRKEEKFYANEINTLPGTLYHHLWEKSGVSLKDLLISLIEYAQERYKEKEDLTSVFESEILSKMPVGKGKGI